MNMEHVRNVETLRQTLTKDQRRRSLRTFFQLPLSTRTAIYGSAPSAAPVGSIPADIVREIVDLLPPADILSLSLTSKHLRTLLMPALYETVTLKSSKDCKNTLQMLKERRDICSYVRKLAVRPNYYLAWPKPDEELSELWVVEMVEEISKDLTNMHTFDWDGLEQPMGSLWTTLRLNCPQLKNVFSNVGTQPLDLNSSLFDFSDLTSFSLIVRHGLGGSEVFPNLETIPHRFWDMILNRCPNLQELAICSFSSSARVFDFDRITEGHWPKLHTLTLGSFGYQPDFTIGPPSIEMGLGSFLDRHRELKYMRFLWNFRKWMSPDDIPLYLSSYSLPVLDTFIGVYQQLSELPNPQTIQTLDLTCEPVYETRLTTICCALKSLTNLTSLDIWAHLVDENLDHSAFYQTILSSCPKLTDFHFMCTTSFTVKPLKQLVTQLHFLPVLKRFSLTKGHKYLDESMLSTAITIVKYNPKLEQVNVRWARERCPNHLKQEGLYDVVHDRDGQPEAINVIERGIPFVGSPFYRKYKHKLENGDATSKVRRNVTVKKERKNRFSIISIN